MKIGTQLRIARPTDNLLAISNMYQKGLGFEILAKFENHDGFDGIILGNPDELYHLEFTHHRGTSVGRAPTDDNLLVFYIPGNNDWKKSCIQMALSGFRSVPSYNPYWDIHGKTYKDIDGYRIVLQNAAWG